MKSNKYYDYKRNCAIDLDIDGCNLDDWSHKYSTSSFAVHSSGFMVFIEPNQITSSDEYMDEDPYSVDLNIKSDFHQVRIDNTLEMLLKCLGQDAVKHKILDLGCGQGHITAKIKKTYPDAEVSGLDYSISAINYANKKFPFIDFIVGNAYEIPYAKDYFDVIVCNNLWEHIPDPLCLLKQISKILKPSGFLIISTPSRYRLTNLIRVMAGKPVIFISQNHITEYSVGQVIEQLNYGNYEIKYIYSKKVKFPTLKGKLAHLFFSFIMLFIRTHHQIEPTVFYLAQKNNCSLQNL